MRRRTDEQPVSDINITPLTDVMLVLLIIFMISSPILLTRGMEVHLPQVENPPMLVEEDHVLYIASDSSISLDGKNIEINLLGTEFEKLVNEADRTGDTVNLFIHGDKDVTYGDITKIMDIATEAGIERISLVQDIAAKGITSVPGDESLSVSEGEPETLPTE